MVFVLSFGAIGGYRPILAEGWNGSVTVQLDNGVQVAGLSEEQKKEMFLKAREDLFPVSGPVASATPAPQPTPQKSSIKKKVSTSEKSLSAQKRKNSQKQEAKKTKAKAVEKNEDSQEDSSAYRLVDEQGSKKRGIRSQREEGYEKKNPSKKSSKTQFDSQIHIMKSGYQEDEGLIPPPAQKEKKGWFKRSSYRYLTPAVRRAIDCAPVKKGRWKYIIIHNSGTRQGNARVFDIYHRRVRHMQNGLAYHFVIGNGRSSGNGQIEIGPRWKRQINGGHVASDYLNNIAIGICLVGDYNRDTPTSQELASLEELINYLRNRVGRYRGRPAIVLGHREINPKPTDCPGKRFPLRWLHQKFPNR